jgi:hypothetical protein
VEMSFPPNRSSHLVKCELRDTPHRRSFAPAWERFWIGSAVRSSFA